MLSSLSLIHIPWNGFWSAYCPSPQRLTWRGQTSDACSLSSREYFRERLRQRSCNSCCLPIPVVIPLGGTCQIPLFRSHDFSPPKKQTRFHDILNCLNTLFFGRPQHLENFVRILAITFSDSLAIFGKNLPADVGKFTPANFFHRKIPGSLPVPITLWEPS